MSYAGNSSQSERGEYNERRKTVYVLPSCIPYAETILETYVLETKLQREKQNNDAVKVKLQEAVASQMHLEARVQLERTLRDELAGLQEENEAARDALERRLQQ